MTDDTGAAPRRAQYGEYATAEEQNRAKGASQPSAAHAVPQLEQPAPAAEPTPAPAEAGTLSSSPAERAHPVDRVVTLVLLALGLFTVLISLPGYLTMAEAMQDVYDQLGIGSYADPELASTLGVTAILIMAALWVAGAVFAIIALRRNRRAWWIPVLAGVLAFITLMTIVTIALMADPAFMEYISASTAAPLSAGTDS